MDRFQNKERRHPLCPGCRYDLVATVDANKRVCPECGYEFTMSELIRAPRKGDWNLKIGLRNTVVTSVIRSLIALPFWAAALYAASFLINIFPFGFGFMFIGALGGVALITAIPGISIGYFLSKDLVEKAGFKSIIVTLIASIFAVIMIKCGTIIATQFNPMPSWSGFTTYCTAGFAVIWIVKKTMVDE